MMPPEMAATITAHYGTPHGNFLRLIFADEVELTDPGLAEGYRWMAEKDRWAISLTMLNRTPWCWWCYEYARAHHLGAGTNSFRDEVPRSVLPDPADAATSLNHDSPAAADAALATAFAALSPGDRAALWAWAWTENPKKPRCGLANPATGVS